MLNIVKPEILEIINKQQPSFFAAIPAPVTTGSPAIPQTIMQQYFGQVGASYAHVDAGRESAAAVAVRSFKP